MASLWQLFVDIKGDNSGYKSAIKGAQTDTVQFGATADSVTARVSASFSKLAGSIGFAAIGAGALAAASKFQEAGAQIARATGATGDQLKALETSFTNVYKKTAAGSTDVATVLSLLSTRTQATGKDLEDLTLKTIKLAKTQREDVTQIVPLVTRAFGDWSIATGSQSRAMDYLRVVSQTTGTAVSRLAEQVVYAGAPLRQLGYSFEQSAALIGKFEKEGVNTELVIGGMKAALQKFAKDGVTDTAKAWQDFVAKVRSGGLTLTDVLKEVGAKRGVDLFKAIQEGRFEIDAMVKSSGDLAANGSANVETFKTTIVKLQHELETLVSGHYQLITAVGLTYPLWSKLLPLITGVVSGASVALVSRLVPAVAEATAGTVLLGGTWATTGTTMNTALATATTSAVTLSGVLAGIGIVLAGIVAGYVAWKNAQKDIKPLDTNRPEGALGSGYTFHGFYAAPNNAGQPVANRPDPNYGPVAPLTPAPSGGGAGAGNSASSFFIYQAASAEQAANAVNGAKDSIRKFMDAIGGLKEYGAEVWSDLSKSVLDFSVLVEAVGPLTAEMVEIPAKSFADSLSPAIRESEAAMHSLGIASTRELRAAYDAAMDAARAMVANGAGVNDVAAAMERVAELSKKLSERTGGWDGQAKGVKAVRVELNDFQRQIDRSFNSLSHGIAKSIVEWKGFGSTLKDIAKDTATSFLEIMIRQLLKPLEAQFAKLAGALGKALGLGGGAASGAASGAAGAAGSAGSAASGAGGALSSVDGVAGAVNMASGIVSAVSGVVGNFQMAGMNKSLDVLVNHTLRIFNVVFQMLDEMYLFKGQLFAKLDDMWRTNLNIYDLLGKGGGSGAGGKGGINFTNCSFTGSPNEIASAIFTQAQLAGAI